MIDLTIKTLDSQNHKFRVPDTYSVLELKEHIVDQVNIPVVQQRLIFCGRVLNNESKLADIGIDGKVMHLVQKIPQLASTTSGSSSSTTTNTNSRSGPNAGPGFRGWHTHGHDPTVLFGAIGIPSELMHTGELNRLVNARSHGTGNRLSLAIDMLRRSNEILNRLENPTPSNPVSSGQSSASDNEQYPQTHDLPEPTATTQEPPEPSAQPIPSDPDSVNVSYEVDETFPNTVVVTIDATHHMRMPPGLLRQMQNRLQTSDSVPQNPPETTENDATNIPDPTIPTESNNQSSGGQASGTLPPSSATSEPSSRNDRQTPETRSSVAINDRRRLRELIDQLNKFNTRLQPFHALYCQYINEDPQFESVEGNNGSRRAQTVFNSVSEIMHYLSHVYHAISDLRVAFNRPPPRAFQSRPCLLQGTILHTAHSVTTTTSATPPPPPPPPSTQQPTSTQTTNTSQSIPSVRAIRLDILNPERIGTETSNVSTSATSTETNSNTMIDPNTENNTTSTEFPSEAAAPHGVELMFDLTPGTIRIDSVEAFVTPNAPGSSHPTVVSQPSSSNETSNNLSMPIDWMDQMIDVISSGVRRPFMADQSLDWSSIPTTSTRTPRVTPRTTDSSSTSNPPSQGISHGHGHGRWDSSPRMDPFLPCSSHHFESNLRPMVLTRRTTQGTDRSTSSNSGNSTTDTSSPSSPNEMRPFSVRRSGRSRTRYVPESEPFLAGMHPVISWTRHPRDNTATTSASNNVLRTGIPNTLAAHIRNGMENVFDQIETEIDLDRARSDMEPDIYPTPESTSLARQLARQPDELLVTPINDIPYISTLEGRYLTVDLFLLIARNWTLYDILHLNTTSPESSIVQNPITRNSERIVNFFVDRIMRNLQPVAQNIDAAANRIYSELLPYLNIFQLSVPTRTNIDINASFLRCITQNLRTIILYCLENRADAINNIGSSLILFAEGFLSLIVYCCNNCSIFRLSIGSIMRFFPLHPRLHRIVMEEIQLNIDRYWNNISSTPMLNLSIVDYIVPINSIEYEVGQTSQMSNDVQSSIPTFSSSGTVDEPLPEVVIGSQEWHHGVPSEWVPVITRDSQRQRRQGTQPPYSDAYLSGMPNKRRKIVTNSKPQGPLSQIIAKNLEVAMGAAGVTIKKEVTTSVGADSEVQSAYTERIRTFGRSGLDTHPDFCPDRYPNASKFFYDPNHPN